MSNGSDMALPSLLPTGSIARVKTAAERLAWAMREAGNIGPSPLAHIVGTNSGQISRLRDPGERPYPRSESIKPLAAALGQDWLWIAENIGERREYPRAAKAKFPEGRERYGKQYRAAFKTLWKKHRVPIPEALEVAVLFHEREDVTSQHIVNIVLEARKAPSAETEVSAAEFDEKDD